VGWRNFVAMGDSFTEGMNDPYPDGSYRGWADLVAARLAVEQGPDFGYANLAIRGRLVDQVIAEQLEPTLAMRPDLVSFAAGGNDVLRRKVDVRALVDKIDTVVGKLRATGADVILFRFADVAAILPGQRIVGPRAAALNDGVGDLAAKHGAYLIDLFADQAFSNPLLWSSDLMLVPPMPAPTPWLLARGADLRWAGQHFAPWLKRRLIGASSGDLITAKRPELSHIDQIA
jgi:lysophospholipase L1-like esterase